MDDIKINVLGFDDFLIEYITELYIDNKDFQYIKSNDHSTYIIDNVSFLYKDKLKYLQESNTSFFKNCKGIVVIFKTKDTKNIKNIWLNELYNNCPNNEIPILFLEVDGNHKSHVHLPHNFYSKYKYIGHSITTIENKELTKKIFNNFLKKISRLYK